MIKLSEEHMSKWARRTLLQVSQVMNAEKKLLKEIKSATPVNTRMIRKQSSLPADSGESFSGLDRR